MSRTEAAAATAADAIAWAAALYDPQDLFRGNHHVAPASP